MSVTKDKTTGKWMSQIRVTDWTGKTIHKKKRGFLTKKEALAWEQEYRNIANASMGMLFKDFAELYFKDMGARLKSSTMANKRLLYRVKILPYFGERPMNEITAADIRKWQNELFSGQVSGHSYSTIYLKTINHQLTAIFNYAVKYYNLRENPCLKAGTPGSGHAEEMQFWTKEEFLAFLKGFEQEDTPYTIFMTLYYTGMREGELLALTPADIDFRESVIRINKTYQRLDKRDIITTPKTPKSKRVITISPALCTCLEKYLKAHAFAPSERMFPYTKSYLYRKMVEGCKQTGVKRIRVHDIRHSHASLLVEMGFSPLLIAERLGHERVQTTMNTYSHLYPNKQAEVAKQLEDYMAGVHESG